DNGQNLDGEDLSGLDLSGINFRKITLYRANLSWANLSEAVFHENDLRGSDFSHSNLQGVNLHMADLSQADLSGADLSKANLHMAKLIKADLRRAGLREANLHGCNLRRANLTGADFQDALLLGSNLEGALLTQADLEKIDLSRVINSSVRLVDRAEEMEEAEEPAGSEPVEQAEESVTEEKESVPVPDEAVEKVEKKPEEPPAEQEETVPAPEEPALPGRSSLKGQPSRIRMAAVAVAGLAAIIGIIFISLRKPQTGAGQLDCRFKLIDPPRVGFVENSILKIQALKKNDTLGYLLWVKLKNDFNRKEILTKLIRSKEDPRNWEYPIDEKIESGSYRLFCGFRKNRLLPAINGETVLISVKPPGYSLTRRLTTKENQEYSLDFKGSLSQITKQNTPYLLVKIGPYRRIIVRPEPVRIRGSELKYDLDVKLNGLMKDDLVYEDKGFYEEYLCDRTGHKILLSREKNRHDFFSQAGKIISYENDPGLPDRRYPDAILPEEGNKLRKIKLSFTSALKEFRLSFKKANKQGEVLLNINKPFYFKEAPVYIYRNHRLIMITSNSIFKDYFPAGLNLYYGLLLGKQEVIFESTPVEITGSGKPPKPPKKTLIEIIGNSLLTKHQFLTF
ncbi:MAG: pentapeptide repeat-containing protein, partial [bacterium]